MKRAHVVFDTTSAALWAEDVAREGGVPVEVVPPPAGAKALCDLALELRGEDLGRLTALLTDHGVPHRPFV